MSGCNAQNRQNIQLNDTVKLSDFRWVKSFEGGGSVSNVVISVESKTVNIVNFEKRLGDIINIISCDLNGDTIQYNIKDSTKFMDRNKNNSRVTNYVKSERSVIEYSNTYHQINTCQIPLTDSTKIKKLDLKYILECPRGCDLKSSIIAYFDDKTLELKFTRNMTIGSMYIHDIVQYDATSFVISFWYYKRGGGEWISDVRVGLLDLKQYLNN